MHYLFTDWQHMNKASPAVPHTRYEPFQPAQTSRPSATSATRRKLEHHKGWQNPTKPGLVRLEGSPLLDALFTMNSRSNEGSTMFNHRFPSETPKVGRSSLSWFGPWSWTPFKPSHWLPGMLIAWAAGGKKTVKLLQTEMELGWIWTEHSPHVMFFFNLAHYDPTEWFPLE